MKRKTISADEYDLTSWIRRYLKWKRGETSAIKRRMNRGERHEAKQELRKETE